MAFEYDGNTHSPAFHFEDLDNNVIDGVEYSLHYSSENNGYDSDEAPIFPEYYAASVTILNDNEYMLEGQSYIVFHIDPSKEGLDYMKRNFVAANKTWGSDGNNGVVADNVTFNEKNILITVDGASRTGGAISSKSYYEQGSFEFIASTNATSGVCMAFWTFYYANSGQINHEIDFELYGQNSIIYSSYIGEGKDYHTSVRDTVDFNIPDNKMHTYRFDWYKGEKVEYYIDGKLVCVIEENVPTLPMKVWIGAWCPSWAGVSTDTKSTMTVYSFKYKSFD